ncbi:hypothetical protein [Pseudomonas syringae]|uniref:hypothetical protein n=1 Tax=Pseudomonas syringae TaxID=317 RepID=UPI000464787B|nr:hypothetical protein [Pseudomonas syringae]
MDVFDSQVPKGRFRVLSDTGMQLGFIEDQRRVMDGDRVIYEVYGEQITDAIHNDDLIGVFSGLEGRTLSGTLMFTLEPA